MVFSSFIFLFCFLPIFLLCYLLTPSKFKNLTVLVASYVFYSWGAPQVVMLLFLSSVADFYLSKRMSRSTETERKHLLFLGLFYNLGFLVYYKYSNFFVAESNRILSALGFSEAEWSAVVLPIGISFFTLQKLSYLIDVYRERAKPADNLLNYALYVSLFPQLIAGPIVRYHDICDQIGSRLHRLDDILEGAYRFGLGLAKKVLIADQMGNVASNVMKLSGDELSTPYAWLGIICYAYQIFFDFSGYSDMAIGLGKMMGFNFLENFDRPYIAKNFTEFWRRWHISLSRWMRDYLYIPLGGNRVSKGKMYFNLWVVFFLSGLWHGANWTFIVWGLFHGLFLVLDKIFWVKFSERLGSLINTLITFVLVCIGWVFFRADTLSQALDYLARMFNFVRYGELPVYVLRGTIIHNQGIFIFIVATLVCFSPTLPKLINIRIEDLTFGKRIRLSLARFSISAACLLLSALALSTTSFAPFIYFQF